MSEYRKELPHHERWVHVTPCGACAYARSPKTPIAADRGDVFRCDNTKSPCYGRVTYGDDFCSRGKWKDGA